MFVFRGFGFGAGCGIYRGRAGVDIGSNVVLGSAVGNGPGLGYGPLLPKKPEQPCIPENCVEISVQLGISKYIGSLSVCGLTLN